MILLLPPPLGKVKLVLRLLLGDLLGDSDYLPLELQETFPGLTDGVVLRLFLVVEF